MDNSAQNPLDVSNSPAPVSPTAPPVEPTPIPETPPPSVPPPAQEIPPTTPPQESFAPQPIQPQVQDLTGLDQPPPQVPTMETSPQEQTPPPPPPIENNHSSPKGFILGGLLALLVVAGIFGAMTFLNKKNEVAPPPPAAQTPKKTQVPSASQNLIPSFTPAVTSSPTAVPTPKTAETYINSIQKYKFGYPLGLSAPAAQPADAVRFPKALDIVKLNLYQNPAESSASAYFIVWDKDEDVPKYIMDGQSQFVKVNIYTTNRFTVKKAGSIEETHYLTKKFENIYDIMLENPGGKISDPVFEKILDSFTFIESAATPTPTPLKTSSPLASPKP